VRIVAPRETSVAEALASSRALLEATVTDGEARVAAQIVRGSAVVLGAHQRAGRVVRIEACAGAGVPVHRRATSGIAAFVDGTALLWTLALPHVAAIHPDATARTLLNRNVRGFLKGLTRAGAHAAYFGRAVIAVRSGDARVPAALLGFDVTPSGAVLLEVLAGFDATLAIPASLATEEELVRDRARGPLAHALGVGLRHDARELAAIVIEALTVGARATHEAPPRVVPFHPLTSPGDPMPEGFVAGPSVAVPIGVLDTGHDAAGRVWLGGDALAPSHLYRSIAEGLAASPDVAIDGATVADLREATRLARG
jgi:hypothetical protein